MNRPNHTLGSLGASALLLLAAGQASARGTVSVYVGPDGSAWNVPANWTAGVPNGDFDAVVNDAGSDITVFVNALVHLNNLRIDAGDTVHIDNGREIRMHTYGGSSTIDNAGTLQLGSTVSNTYLRFDPEIDGETFTLVGGGEIVGSDGGFNWIYEVGGQAVLHNLDNTIRGGRLNLGSNNLEIINDALVVSDSGDTITIDPPQEANFDNNGTIRADGGTVHLDAGLFDNVGGVIEALNGSVVELDGCTILGGTLRGDDLSEVRQSGTFSYLALDQTVTVEGTLRINNGREVRTFGAGTIHNTGIIRLDSTGSNTYFRLDPETDGGIVQLTGGGEIVGSDGGFNWIYEVGGQAVLHNLDNTIRGGRLNLGSNNLPVVNFGTILGDSDAHPLFIDPPTDAPGFDNQGLLQATGTAGVDIAAGLFTTSGTVDIALGSVISRSGDWTQTGGSTNVDGNLTVTGGVVDLQGGTLAGNGSVNGNVNNVSGSVAPGSSAGTLTIIGDYVQGTNGTLAIELGGTVPGTQHDVLAIDGDAQLAGSLTLTPIDGYEPLLGDEFTILTTTGVVIDQFEFVDCGALYQVSYEDSAVIVSVIGEPVEGDLNCDGCVNQSDLGILLGGYGTSDAGDLDGDGDTDQSDLGILLGAYGNGC